MDAQSQDGRGVLQIVPVSLEEANAFVKQHHRHHDPVTGHKFSIGLSDGATIRGVVIVGRPVSRLLDDGWTLEVNRCCTDGVENGCSMLYRTAWRAALALGYRKLITYTMKEEGGSSLKASGWKCLGECGGGSWSRTDRPRVDTHPLQTKLRWELAIVALLLLCGCGGGHVATVPPLSNPFPVAAWVHERSTNDPVASPSLPWVVFSLHAITTTNCLPIGVTNDGPYLKIPHLGQLWYFVVFTNKGPDSGWVEFTTRYVTQP